MQPLYKEDTVFDGIRPAQQGLVEASPTVETERLQSYQPTKSQACQGVYDILNTLIDGQMLIVLAYVPGIAHFRVRKLSAMKDNHYVEVLAHDVALDTLFPLVLPWYHTFGFYFGSNFEEMLD